MAFRVGNDAVHILGKVVFDYTLAVNKRLHHDQMNFLGTKQKHINMLEATFLISRLDPPAQYLGGVHRGGCACVYREMSVSACMNVCFAKKIKKIQYA